MYCIKLHDHGTIVYKESLNKEPTQLQNKEIFDDKYNSSQV